LALGAAAARLAWDSRQAGRSHDEAFGRSRHLSGLDLDFEPLRQARRQLGGRMIDVLLTGVAGAMSAWYRARGETDVQEVLTAVPINLRPPEEMGLDAAIGNRTTMVMVRLPLHLRDPRERFAEIHRRVEEAKASPATDATPAFAKLLSGTPRWLFRRFSVPLSANMDLIVTNVPGLPVRRYLAGAEITGGYPIAPTGPHTPVSIALYGYAGRLFVGLDADGTAMPDAETFREQLAHAFAEVVAAAGVEARADAEKKRPTEE
ncbi:MAG: DUF1298 domain-containing protein, partial [Deltaproteobacteria bacterium]|nr:DUF1298 domain-containing protein [Deltaproteobacteria bacterium]